MDAKVVRLSPQTEAIITDRGSVMIVAGARVTHLTDRELRNLLVHGRAALLELKPTAQV